MIFMHNDTGGIYEILIKNLNGTFNYGDDLKCFQIGEIVVHGLSVPEVFYPNEMPEKFTFIGWV